MAAKKPKKPKTSASVSSWQKYDEKVRKWEHDRKIKAALIKKYS